MKYATILGGLLRFDAGMKSPVGVLCGLDRGNIQYRGILGLFSKSYYCGLVCLIEMRVDL